MKTYRIRSLSVSVCYLEVEANTEAEAWVKGEEADGGDFTEEESEGYWEITDVEEVKS